MKSITTTELIDKICVDHELFECKIIFNTEGEGKIKGKRNGFTKYKTLYRFYDLDVFKQWYLVRDNFIENE